MAPTSRRPLVLAFVQPQEGIMYENFFGLSQRPFLAAPSAESYLPTSSMEQARQTLIRVIDRAEGPGLVVGPAGTGKTLACQLLAKHFRGRFLVAMLNSTRLATRRALLQNILFELRLPYRDLDDGELRLSLIDHLEPRSEGNDGLLLLVDEAHTLPLRLLEEVRLITNLVRDGQPRVRLVLAGNMAMEERLANPKLESFHQRIAARCYLQSMHRDETIYYVREQIRRAAGSGSPPALFTDDALRAVHTATDGIPRLVNQLCDHALMLAALGGHKQLNPAGIEEAWADLQQLPVPWHEKPQVTAAGEATGVVEFGQLDEIPSYSESNSATQVGPFHAAIGDAVEARLDAIESGVAALREDGGPYSGAADLPREGEPDDFSPADESGTEVELIFHSAHDPFGGGWDEEEVVIDRYAMLEQARLRKVASDEGRQIAAALDAALVPAGPKLAEVEAEFDRATHESLDRDADPIRPAASAAPFDPASDPLLPEEPAAPILPRSAVASLRELAGDDRDLIVVSEESESRKPITPARPRRPEYRQLFSSLRKK
jgi:type II secretory pathway predicted ATPase ExeA